MAAQRSYGLVLCCLVILLATHEAQGLFECFDGCPGRCQRDFHESYIVCAAYCGIKCTCTGGGHCNLAAQATSLEGNDQDLMLLEAARAKVAAEQSPVSTGQSPRKNLLEVN